MSKKKSIPVKRKISIVSHNLKNFNHQGKYFNFKPADLGAIVTQLRTADISTNDLLLDNLRQLDLPINFPGNKVLSVRDLNQNHLNFYDAEIEFYWAKNIISKNTQKIADFIRLSKSYEEKLVNGNYSQAGECLDKIESIFGYSVWSIKNRISFLQLSEGLEDQKKYVQTLKKELPNGRLLRFLIHWISVRNEAQTSVGRFNIQLRYRLDALSDEKQPGFKEYANYHLFNEGLSSPESMTQVLRISFSDNIIDYYLSFVDLLASFASTNADSFKRKIVGATKLLRHCFGDERLPLLENILGFKNEICCFNLELAKEYESILKGEVDWQLLRGRKYGNSTIDLLHKAISYGIILESHENFEQEEDTLGVKILKNSVEILRRGASDAVKEFNELAKIALNFSTASWSSAINILFAKENVNPIFFNQIFADILRIGTLHPLFVDMVAGELGNSYRQLCKDHYSTNVAIEFHFGMIGIGDYLSSNIYPALQNYYNARIAFQKADYLESVNYSEKLKLEKNSYFKRRGYNLISRSYLKLEDLRNCCVNVADCYIKEKNSYSSLPLLELVGELLPGTNTWKSTNDLIDLPIVFDAFQKHVDRGAIKTVEAYRGFAYEDFLFKAGLEKPSQLGPIIKNYELAKIIYYLRYICLESVMDTSSTFIGGSKEVLSERLEVCRLLLEIDPKNDEIYRQEIKEIVRRQVITDRRKEVDESRIYVDVKNIKALAENELEENFDRYQTYLKLGLVSDLITRKKNDIDSSSAMDTPDNEPFALLTHMVQEIRKSYLSADIGLDRFISTRIRHGELERTMRIPIQNHNLITKRVSKNGPYKPNEYWIPRLNENDDFVELNNILKTFSENYDNLISKIANNWLQIKRDDKPQGQFDFTLYEGDIQNISDSLTVETSLMEFIEIVINFLDSNLIVVLVAVRKLLNTKGKSEAKLLINELQDKITGLNLSNNFEIQREIGHARTDLSAQFDKIIEWFVPSSEGSSTPYFISDAISVAEAIIKEDTPTFKIELLTLDSDIYPIHGNLPIFVDIFVNIFENIVKRSGLEIPTGNASIVHNIVSNQIFWINITIVNEIGELANKKLIAENLSKVEAVLLNGTFSELVASENNSGLLKIYKSVHDFKVFDTSKQASMEFDFNGNEFRISLSIPFNMFSISSEEIKNEL